MVLSIENSAPGSEINSEKPSIEKATPKAPVKTVPIKMTISLEKDEPTQKTHQSKGSMGDDGLKKVTYSQNF